jgi:hypothetical protein
MIMKTSQSLLRLFAGITALLLTATSAPAATIQVLETFDYPGTGNLTLPQKINDQGVIVGVFIDVNGVARAFLRGRNGQFSRPFVEPNDTGNLTQGRGINSARIVCGEYLDGNTGNFHGYFLVHGRFTEFDVTDATNTIPLAINEANDFSGTTVLNDGTQPAFFSLGGTITTVAIPDTLATLAYGLNSSNQAAGYYLDLDGVTTHGWARDTDGTLTFPIDPAGSVGTVLFDNNDSNWVVGRYADASGVTHGLFYMSPDDILTFDYPGSAFTSLNGINQNGYICGRFVDSAGIAHGFVAKVNPDETGSSNQGVRITPSNPAHPVVEKVGAATVAF